MSTTSYLHFPALSASNEVIEIHGYRRTWIGTSMADVTIDAPLSTGAPCLIRVEVPTHSLEFELVAA